MSASRVRLAQFAARGALTLPLGSLWMGYVTVLRDASSSRGLEYGLGEWPIALGLVTAGWSGTVRGHGLLICG